METELNIYQNKRNSAISNNSHTADQINTFFRDTYQTTSNPDKHILTYFENNTLPNIQQFTFSVPQTAGE
nr:unnamed protein product [Callosobruchus analis]